MHEHGRDRALALVEARLDDDAARRRVLRRLQLEHFRLQQDRVEQLVDARAGLRGHRDELRLAAVFLGNHALGDQLLLDALEVRFGLVDLVDRDDDRHVAGLRVRDRFLRLRHHAVVGGDDQNHDVGDLRAARAHRRERLVARRVEERDHALLRLHVVRADVLRDPARLAARDARAADRVEQRRLAVVDVAHHRDDRRPRLGLDVGRFGFGEERIRIVLLRGLRLVAHFRGQDDRRLLVEHLVDRDHLAELHQRLDDLGRLHRQLPRELGHGDRLGNRDVADDRRRRALRRAFAAFLVVAPRAADLRLPPADRRRAAGDVAAELERAPPRGFFLESGAALLDRLRALARLRRRTMQRALGRRLRDGRLPGLRRGLGHLGRFGRGGFGIRGGLRRGFLGLALLLGLALDHLLLLLLRLLPAGARSAPAPSSPRLRARRAPRR